MNSKPCFDDPVDRRGTFSVKWGGIGNERDLPVIPLWIADMDFPAPPKVVEALKKRAEHPIYGYTYINPLYYKTLVTWYRDRYGAELETSHFILGRGTVPGLAAAVKAWSEPGDGVLIFTPVYGPFYDVVRMNNRRTVEVPLRLNREGRYCFEIDDMEKALISASNLKVPLMLLCSPHNPGGSVWDRNELASLFDFAEKHNMVICSDEIHSDFAYEPYSFISLASFPSSRTVVISSPNKTFNLGGLHISHYILQDNSLKEKLLKILNGEGWTDPDIFSLVAAEAAYGYGAEWLPALKKYIVDNIEETVGSLNSIPGIKAYKPQGTYLVWACVSGLITAKKLKDEAELVRVLEDEARVKLTAGRSFGEQGRLFIRVNTACPRSLLREALGRLARWAKDDQRR